MTTIKRTLKRLATVGAITLASIMPTQAQSGVAGNVRYIGTTETTPYVETVASYSAPLGIKGCTILDTYGQGNGYFGKTYLNSPSKKGLGSTVQVVHGNEFQTATNLGIDYNATPRDGTNIDAKLFGITNLAANSVPLELTVSQKLPGNIDGLLYADFRLNDHGRLNYGELLLTKDVKGVKVGYDPSFTANRHHLDLEHRVSVGVNF
jgi:hypothetical protein